MMDVRTFQKIAIIQFKYTTWVMGANLKGLTDEQGLQQPPEGNCLNWVAGHVMQARSGILHLTRQATPFAAGKYERYERGSAPVVEAAGTVPLTEMLTDFMATEEGLKKGIAGLRAEMLAAKAPFSPSNDETETIGSLLAGLVFHEAYHCGQLGTLRRLVGGDGTIK